MATDKQKLALLKKHAKLVSPLTRDFLHLVSETPLDKFSPAQRERLEQAWIDGESTIEQAEEAAEQAQEQAAMAPAPKDEAAESPAKDE